MNEIFLREPDLPREFFFVISCQPVNEQLYSCRTIFAEDLERESDRIEEEIVRGASEVSL